MRRTLTVLTLGLLALVIADRLTRTASTVQASQGASASVPPADERTGIRTGSARPETGRSATPSLSPQSTVERLARLATRRQLSYLSTGTYVDSLIVTTDSVVRRWPDRDRKPLRIFLIEGGPSGYQPRMAAIAHAALDRWEEANVGVTFTTVTDSASADVTVAWIDHFTIDRSGQTDLTWDPSGQVHHASISLAIRTNTGFTLPDGALLAVATHEVGHAIGLPHSADTADVMFPSTRTSVLSDRDRKTAQVLYRLPVGPLRDAAPALH